MARSRTINTDVSDRASEEAEPEAVRVTFGERIRASVREANRGRDHAKTSALHSVEIALGDLKRAAAAAEAHTEGDLREAMQSIVAEL